jgi:hypothetical protein
MKDIEIDTSLMNQSGWSKFFAPIAAGAIVILLGVLTYVLFVSSQFGSSPP